MLAEIQQTSDITYRVFDFNRKDKEGNLRELHTELALDAIDFDKKDDFKVEYFSESINVEIFDMNGKSLIQQEKWSFSGNIFTLRKSSQLISYQNEIVANLLATKRE